MKKLYPGSDKFLEMPSHDFEHIGATDYGKYGFYCTQDIEAAKEWACKSGSTGFLCEYEIDDRGLKILDLTDMNRFNVLNWFAILCNNREFDSRFKQLYKTRIDFLISSYLNIDINEYDVVIGYRADDDYFSFPTGFIQGDLLLESLEEVYKLGDLGLQYVLMSQKAFTKLKYLSTKPVESKYARLYKSRIGLAVDKYNEILLHDLNSDGTRITDLMKND